MTKLRDFLTSPGSKGLPEHHERVVYLIFCDLLGDSFWLYPIFRGTEMLEEVSRREKEAGIYPEPEVDAFMKVSDYFGQES